MIYIFDTETMLYKITAVTNKRIWYQKLTVESPSVNTLTSRPVPTRKIPPLTHESRYNPMKPASFVPEPLFPGAQRLEVRCGFGNGFSVETEFDTAHWDGVGGDVEVDPVGDGGCGGAGGEEIGEEVHAQ